MLFRSFSLTKLDVAVTFCKVCTVALAFSSHTKIDRELEHVEHALVSALRTREKVKLKPHRQNQFREKVEQLEALLSLLAERVPGPKMQGIERCLTRFKFIEG